MKNGRVAIIFFNKRLGGRFVHRTSYHKLITGGVLLRSHQSLVHKMAAVLCGDDLICL